MKRFILRYGVFTILILTALILLAVSRSFETRAKIPVHLFQTENGEYRVYVPYGENPVPVCGDTITVEQTTGGNVPFVITGTRREPSSTVLLLRLADAKAGKSASLGGDTYSGGFVVAGRTNLADHLLKGFRR